MYILYMYIDMYTCTDLHFITLHSIDLCLGSASFCQGSSHPGFMVNHSYHNCTNVCTVLTLVEYCDNMTILCGIQQTELYGGGSTTGGT